MPRLSGQVTPTIPSTAPESYRLSHEVYSLDGDGNVAGCFTGPPVENGSNHVHSVCSCQKGMGEFPGGTRGMVIAGVGLAAVWWFFLRKKR